MFRKHPFRILLFYFALLLLGYNFNAFAGHRPGGTYSWECIGPNTYVITFTRITNCGKNLDDDAKYCLTGSLGGDPNNGEYEIDSAYSISHPVRFCDGTSTCCGGCYNWPIEVVYIDTIVLTPPISPTYTIYYCDGGNRPNADNGSTSGGFYIEATFDTTAPCNSSAVPTVFHEVFYCIGDTGCIINDYVDSDGDSLVFYLGDCYNYTYNGGFSGADPMTSNIGWSVDSVGNICFLPPAEQTGYICMVVEEWRDGVKIAENINEMYIYAIDCSILSDTGVFYSAISFDVDLTGNPDTFWLSPNIVRDGSVCGAPCNAECVEFIVTLDTAVEAIIFDVCSGSIPAGALFWQLNCGPPQPVGVELCVTGIGPHRITFCKPGGNTNEYCITSIAKTVIFTDISVNEGCTSDTVFATGFYESTITWTSVYPDSVGTYNSYLSCTTGCDSIQVTAPPNDHPPFVDFEMCGTPEQGCDSLFFLICDTFRVFFTDTLFAKITPDTPVVCLVDSFILTANGIGGAPPFSYLWNTGDTSQTLTVTVPGTYWVAISDTSSMSNCSPGIGLFRVASIIVAGFPAPVTITSGNDTTVCLGTTVQLNEYIQVDTSSFNLIFFSPTSFPIPNNDHNNDNYSTTNGVQSTIDVSGSCYDSITSGMIESVCISIDHDKANEVDIFLACPDGTWIQLSTDNGGDNDYLNTCFTPTASTNITAAAPPFTGDYLPEDNFDNLNGCAVNGTWTLNIQDDGGGKVGALLNWSITFSNDSCIVIDYGWTPGSTLSDSTILNPFATPDSTTDYIFYVSDDYGCKTLTDTIRVTVIPPINFLVSSINLSCFGDSNGVAVVTASGGVPPLTYLWDDDAAQTTDTATGLAAGTYTVTVTDSFGCDTTASVIITAPPPLIADITDSAYVTCNGDSNGTATATVSGGTSPYTYLWNDFSSQTTATASGLSGGVYTVTVTDSNGCVAIDSITIIEPAILSVDSINSTNVSCNGANDGSATVNVSGGTTPYTYFWNSTPSQTTATATGLPPGNYCVTVTDTNGCDTTACVTITEPPLLSGTMTDITNISCNGVNDGTLTVTATGGTLPYTYLWDDDSTQTTSTATGLDTGTYTVTVTDSNGCTILVSATIYEPTVLSIDSINITNVSCFGGSDGSAAVTTSGGMFPYTYLWTPDSQTTATATGLAANTYTVTITDANGCVTLSIVVVTEPPLLIATINFPVPASCFGSSDGEATATPIGGTPPYTYLWTDVFGDTIDTVQVAIFLAPGLYTVTITDANGCISIPPATVIITQPPELLLSITTVPANCGNCDGELCVIGSGGTPFTVGDPYIYFWNSGPIQNTACATNLCPDCYDVTVLDSNGCAAIAGACVVNVDVILVMDSVNVTCYGGSDGQATVWDINNIPPYTYSWTSGSMDSIATGLTAGTYTVTVTNGNGCQASLSTTISQPLPIVSGINITNVSCNGDSTGQAAVTPSGEYLPYTYLWSNGQTTSTATGLTAGTYTVTVTDSIGCDTTISVVVNEPLLLLADITDSTNISCKGAGDGSATVTTSGGVFPYTYLWDDGTGQTTPTAVNLSPGTYTVTVTDANGCVDSASVTLTEPPLLVIDTIIGTDISCNGFCDGQVSVTVSGGSPGYSYIWTTVPSQFTQTADSLCPGTYTVTVVDTNGCDTSASVTITEPTLLTGSITSFTYVSCNGFNDGSATATPSGGTLPYTYLWRDSLGVSIGETDSIADSLYAGNYNVTITDANGCNITLTVTITEPTLLTIDTIVITNVSCYGAGDGMATVTVGGGTPLYTYSWSTGDNVPTTDSLVPGTYCVTVTDANGCDTTACVTITQPDSLLAAITDFTNVACNGDSTGDATVTVLGGTTPYTYTWNPPPAGGQNTSTAFGLPIGTYNVIVTDANGCVDSAGLTITEPPLLVIDTTIGTNISCNGFCDGQVSVTVSGGTPGYSYIWNTTGPQFTPTADSLCPGDWKITVIDSNGCVVIDTVTITEPLILTASITLIIHISCFGGSDGELAVTPAGGTLPYTYQWDDDSTQTTDTATGLVVGTYCVIVTDSSGCSTSVCATINEPAAPLVVTITGSSDATCYGYDDGWTVVVASGGTFPYDYSWNSLPLQTTPTATGLIARCYTVTVTDFNGCVDSASVCINEPPPFTAAITASTNVSCFGVCDGEATVTPSGGTPGYTYVWSTVPIQITPTATGLCAGNYTVDVYDSNSCFTSSTITITQPPVLLASISSITHVSCYGWSDGALTVIPSEEISEPPGGTPPYTYSWTPGGDTTTTIDSLIAGTYTATVTDSNGCTTSVSATIIEPMLLTAGTTINSYVICNGGNEGEATVSVGGGTLPYTYFWSNGDTIPTADSLVAGTYTVIVTDSNGCDTTVSMTITEPLLLIADMTDSANVSCNGVDDGLATVTAGGGTPAYTYSWTLNDTIALSDSIANITGLSPGTYTVTVTDINGCDTTASVIITEPNILTTNITGSTNISCNAANDGLATLTASGGTLPYTYSWSSVPTQDSITATGLLPGTYCVTVTDANGCSDTACVTIIEPPILTASITSITHVNCYGDSTGEAIVLPAGGTLPYTYSWNSVPVQTTDTATGLTAGTYTVTVTDTNGCSTSASATITQPAAAMAASITASTNVSCKDGSDGKATVTVSGGTLLYTYLWDDTGSQTTPTATGLTAGCYTIIVTDFKGCVDSASVCISEPPILDASVSVSTIITCNGGAGQAVLIVSGGTLAYTYLWSNGDTTIAADSLTGGTYLVTVTDAMGCDTSTQITLIDPNPLLISVSIDSSDCNLPTGAASITVFGGVPPYTYLWAPDLQTTDTISGIFAGVYFATITDSLGCEQTVAALVNDRAPFSLQDSTVNASCNGVNDGAITITLSGTLTPPFTYTWQPPVTDTTAFIDSLVAGTYYVTVTDGIGCMISTSAIVTEPFPIVDTITTINVSCNGLCDGSATVIVSNQYPPYTFLWLPSGQTTATATGLCAGNYIVTVTDSTGCDTVVNVVITEPDILETIIDSTNISCFGVDDGVATVTVSGGTTPYTYSWSNGDTVPTADSLPPGNWTVTVTDAQGCDTTDNVVIVEPDTLIATITNVINVSCNGFDDGEATVTVSGGTTPYIYVWSPTPQTDSTANNLAPGSYTVMVIDTNGCITTDSVTITQPPVLTASISSIIHVSCFGGSDGETAVIASGGTLSYTYLWDDDSTQTADTAIGLDTGTYTVIVTDSNGCIVTVSATINQPALLTASITDSTYVSCFGGNDGIATVTVSGGTLPYTYQWDDSNFQTTPTATGLTAGCYTVIITDGKGCNTTAVICITDPPLLTASISSVNISCNGVDDGVATVTAGGGTLPYDYVWNTVPTQFDSMIDSLTPGTYTVIVSDTLGCDTTLNVTITQPDTLIATITNIINVSCYSDSTGAATASVTGGTTPYTYSWNTTPVQIDSSATGFPVGTYTVTVTDTQGCVTTENITITQPDSLVATITASTNATCYADSNGQATASVSGGASPYSYVWNTAPVQTGSTADGLAAASYTVTVMDTLGCVDTANVIISQPDSMAATITAITNVSCKDECDGSATVVGSGGNPPLYGYSWNTFPVQTTSTATGLCSGAYTVTLLDLLGCMATVDTVITEPTILEASITNVINVRCNGACDGEATLAGTGGTTPYAYSWNSTPTQDSITATGLCIGGYTGTVIDSNGCTTNDTVTITEPEVLTASIDSVVHVTCYGAKDGVARVTAAGGTPPYSYLWNDPAAQTNSIATGLDTGTYTVIVTDTNGCMDTVDVTINQPTVLTASITDTIMVSCFGGNDGEATAAGNGAIPPYSYLWDDTLTQNTPMADSLYAGIYTVIVTDDNGCDTTATVTITEPPLLIATITGVRNVYCKDDSTGMAVVTTTGGTSPYTYLWDDVAAQISDTAMGLPTGTYTVIVTDTLGCDTTAVVTITEPEYLVGTISYIKNVYCKGDSTAEANVSMEGGTPPYTYLWNDWTGQTDSLATGLEVGTYCVTITDTLGCDTTVCVTITEPDTLIASITGIRHVYCNGDSTGLATATPIGGTPPYTYSWNTTPVQTDSMAIGLWAGTHVYTIFDTLGCIYTDSVVITEPTAIVITMIDSIVICVGQCVSISASATGGTGTLTYTWNDTLGTGQGPFITCPTDSIYYVVTVTDSLNCIMEDSTYVDVHPLIVTFAIDDSLCIGDSVQISVSMTGGDGNYSILWPATGDTTEVIVVTPQVSTWYSIIVTDGCGTPAAFDSVFVEVNPYPVIVINPVFASGCQNATLIFVDVIADWPNSTYVWDFGDGSFSDTMTSQTNSGPHTYDTVGTFYVNVWVMTPKGCASYSSTPGVVIISEYPMADFIGSASEASMLTANFLDLSTGDSIVNWWWSFGDDSTSTEQNPSHTYAGIGTYTVQLITGNISGCLDTISKIVIWCANFSTGSDTIVMSPFPVADFKMKGQISFRGEPFETTILFPTIWFTDRTAVADSIVKWFWEFGDGNMDSIQNPIHEYDTVGSKDCNYCYEVQLTVWNKYGCPDTITKSVIIKPEFRVWIPSAFTPNGDGINDIFIVKGVEIVDFQMFIFDRWGMQVFGTNDITIPWDGTVNGGTVIVQQDVYVYLIRITDVFGEEHEFSGTVSVIK